MLSVELRPALIYIVVVVGWAHVEGRVTKHYFCFITCLPSQRERFFVNFDHLDATKRTFSSFFGVFFGLGVGVGWGVITFLGTCIHVACMLPC